MLIPPKTIYQHAHLSQIYWLWRISKIEVQGIIKDNI